MTEFERILTRAGVFELPLPKVNEMMICPKHRHSLGKYWKQRRPCQYPMHHGGRKAIKRREVVNVNMAKEIKKSPRSNCANRFRVDNCLCILALCLFVCLCVCFYYTCKLIYTFHPKKYNAQVVLTNKHNARIQRQLSNLNRLAQLLGGVF